MIVLQHLQEYSQPGYGREQDTRSKGKALYHSEPKPVESEGPERCRRYRPKEACVQQLHEPHGQEGAEGRAVAH